MPTKKKSEPHSNAASNDSGTLHKAAEAIGSTLGKIAVKTGIAEPHKHPATKRSKLVSKGKKRLPRKEKKRLQKASAVKKSSETPPSE